MDEDEALARVVFRIKGQCSDAGVEIVREYVAVEVAALQEKLRQAEQSAKEGWEAAHATGFPHMCRDEHDEIRFKDSAGEECPICVERRQVDYYDMRFTHEETGRKQAEEKLRQAEERLADREGELEDAYLEDATFEAMRVRAERAEALEKEGR